MIGTLHSVSTYLLIQVARNHLQSVHSIADRHYKYPYRVACSRTYQTPKSLPSSRDPVESE